MYIATAKTETWEEDFPGSRVKWVVGQSREIHDSLVERFRNNPAAWTVSGGNNYGQLLNLVCTQAQYDAIAVKDANTQYNIVAG